ncbi:ATP-dependent DNA helicase RecG [Ktedonospora formicarum]|uniref:ATP-dependent DNA helicase RecG n=1 Tax=Ktedonospora formicarum TaxID=2778364 RepID=A0A8J3HSZ6_9CHLR|nr:ATP-dependent DNA helicase RecG [Ktedonospora formicarum]GHO43412.1 ATP-dependent DNA helicase RecG [Ktedonospora formicarum]
MSQTSTNALAPHIERARKIFQHEQRTNYQDKAILGGGLESFVERWVADTRPLMQDAGFDLTLLQRFQTHLGGYRQLEPAERANHLRLALAILNEMAQPTSTTPETKALLHATGKGQPTTKSDDVAVKPRSQVKKPTIQSEPRPPMPIEQPDVPLATRPVQPPPPPPPNTIHLEAGMSQGHTSLTLLSADVSAVPGVGPTILKRLHHLGIRTIRDLLFYFPREHRDYSKMTPIADIPFNEVTTTMGLIWEVSVKRTGKGGTRTIATISDDSGKLYATWFNQPYLQKQLERAQGCYIVVTGKKARFGNKVEFTVQSHELPEQNDLLNTGRLVPTYALTEGLSAKVLRRFTKWVVDRYALMVPEHLSPDIRQMGSLITLPQAVAKIHYPDNEAERVIAHRRLAFDELFMIQLGMQERRSRWQYEAPLGSAFTIYHDKIFIDPPTNDTEENSDSQAEHVGIGSTLWSVTATNEPLEATLPFRFTDAQRRVIREIFADLARPQPMCRLLQGDVGAGKTAVAAAALFMTVLNGSQGAIMAPTELLAEQHARSISQMLEPFGIRTVLLTGSQRASERARGRAMLESGEAAVAIGTHALIQDDVRFYKLGLVVVDEQHRFGVEQRDALRKKGYHPHMLVMTATPIPRTLSLTLYGDLDVSVIDQLPPGRQKIITRWRIGARRSESYELIRQQVNEERQAFIICPLIEESESLQVKAATTEYERLQREVFPKLRLGLLHGAMKTTEKDQIMHRFRNRELDILIATSVIEVGIDVPNATVMVIEDADRFGLSQLHQFRGRVGRGKHQSYCYVLSADAGIQSQERLGVFEEIDDGFRLAEEDLRLRGPGDFIGVRQSGMPELRIADLGDTHMIELTRNIADKIWASDPYLRQPEHTALRERMHLFWHEFMSH